jgi:hypothetical protein
MRALYIFLILILLSSTPYLHAATEQRIALVIGNSAYSSGPLKNPVNDATDIAATLQRLGFSVIIKKNASQRVMEESIREFGNKLKKGGVGLFYYAGHGLQINGVNYLIPVAAKINEESDVKYEAIDANKVLDAMANANNGLNIVILDACRDNPFTRSFRDATRGLAIVSTAPVGTFISYSTGPGGVARDGEGRNSPYAAALIKHMKEPGQPVEQVFKSVRQTLANQSGGKQIPWELSSLQGNFFFTPGHSKMVTDTDKSEADTDALDDEQRKVELEKQRLEKEESLLTEKAALEEKRRKLEAKKKQLAMGARASVSTANEIKRDGRFIAYEDGTVLDTSTNLMWAVKDNGSNINWVAAKFYCENYRAGRYKDWRMPTQDELAGLYDSGKTQGSYDVHLTEMIQPSSYCFWASETRGSDAALFNFHEGSRIWRRQSISEYYTRVLPVRSPEVKKESRFIDNGNGTVTDTRTGLMWAAKDNGKGGMNWYDAKSYCENYRVGGYTDWRMPTLDELKELYDESQSKSQPIDFGGPNHVITDLIYLTGGIVWSSETHDSEYSKPYVYTGGGFGFVNGDRGNYDRYKRGDYIRVLPVRSGK